MDLKFSMEIDLDNISQEFHGQGHRLKVKVARSKIIIFKVSDGLTYADSLCHVITSFDLFGEENWQGVHDVGGRVNAQVFSLILQMKILLKHTCTTTTDTTQFSGILMGAL